MFILTERGSLTAKNFKPHVTGQTFTYVKHCVIWYQSLFGVCMIDQMHANTFFYLLFLSVFMSQYVVQMGLSNLKRQNANQTGQETHSNLMTFGCCFLISKYHESCNAMSYFTFLHECYSRFLNCTNAAKLLKASDILKV